MSGKVFTIAIFTGLLAACTETGNGNVDAPQETYVTNAEYVLGKIENEGAAGIVLHLKPRIKASCSHMYAEISHRASSDEPWGVVAALWPGKNHEERYGERFIENQMYFMALSTQGQHALTAFGCKPTSGDMQIARGLMALFTPEPGALSYLGEVGTWDGRKRFTKIEINDRSDMALEKVAAINPGLVSYFRPALMERYEAELSPEQERALKAMGDKAREMQEKLALRRSVMEAYNEDFSAYASLKAVNGGISNRVLSPEGQAERDMLTSRMAGNKILLEKLDIMLAQNETLARMKTYIRLHNDAYIAKPGERPPNAWRALNAFEKGNSPAPSTAKAPGNSERDRLVKAYNKAEAAYDQSREDGLFEAADTMSFRRNIYRIKSKEAEFALARYDQGRAWQKEGKSAEFIETALELLEAADAAEIAYDLHCHEFGDDVPKADIPERNRLYRSKQDAERVYEEFVGAR